MRLNFEKIEEFTKINTEIIYQRKIKSCCKLNNNKKNSSKQNNKANILGKNCSQNDEVSVLLNKFEAPTNEKKN